MYNNHRYKTCFLPEKMYKEVKNYTDNLYFYLASPITISIYTLKEATVYCFKKKR